MKTRSSHNWNANLPGGWDVLNTFRIFPASNCFGIPEMDISEVAIEGKNLVPFNLKQYGQENICHFFLDDYHFERLWNRPTYYLPILKKEYYAILTPDFSVYTDYPYAMNVWNTYRNRWLGKFWQENGIRVIPTIGWADEGSYEYAFLGVPKGSIVAISPPDLRREAVYDLFVKGLKKMIQVINPQKIISYGKMPIDCQTEVIVYPKRYFRGVKI